MVEAERDQEEEVHDSREEFPEVSEESIERIEPEEIDKLRNTFLYHPDTDLSHRASEILTRVEKSQSYDSIEEMPGEKEMKDEEFQKMDLEDEEIQRLENTLRWGGTDALREEASRRLQADETHRWIRENVTSSLDDAEVGREIRSFLRGENKKERTNKLLAHLDHELGVDEGTAGVVMGEMESEGMLAEELLDHVREKTFPHLKELGRIASYHPDADARKLSIATLGRMKKGGYVRPEVADPLLDVVENYVKEKGLNDSKNAGEAVDYLKRVHFEPLDPEEDEKHIKRLANRFKKLEGELEGEWKYPDTPFGKDMEEKMGEIRKNFEIETGFDIDTGKKKKLSLMDRIKSVSHLFLRSTVLTS